MKNYFFSTDIETEELGKGISRKILAYNGNLMSVEVNFQEGSVGELHSHPHEQMTYILEGEFLFKIKNQEKIVRVGDVLYKEANAIHGCKCLKKGKLLDIFTPIRNDFLK